MPIWMNLEPKIILTEHITQYHHHQNETSIVTTPEPREQESVQATERAERFLTTYTHKAFQANKFFKV